MNLFIDCNDKMRSKKLVSVFDDLSLSTPYEISDLEFFKELDESIESGLIPIKKDGIYVRDDFGALVCECPANCKDINDFLNYTSKDFYRTEVGKPNPLKEYLLGASFIAETKVFDKYREMMETYGMDLVVGPGCVVHGCKFKKAIYCRNYQEVMEKQQDKKSKTMHL